MDNLLHFWIHQELADCFTVRIFSSVAISEAFHLTSKHLSLEVMLSFLVSFLFAFNGSLIRISFAASYPSWTRRLSFASVGCIFVVGEFLSAVFFWLQHYCRYQCALSAYLSPTLNWACLLTPYTVHLPSKFITKPIHIWISETSRSKSRFASCADFSFTTAFLTGVPIRP